MDKLKPCPFCGGEAEIVQFDDTRSGELVPGHGLRYSRTMSWWKPQCTSCDAVMDNGWGSEAEAIAAWNKRVDRNATIEECEDAVNDILANGLYNGPYPHEICDVVAGVLESCKAQIRALKED